MTFLGHENVGRHCGEGGITIHVCLGGGWPNRNKKEKNAEFQTSFVPPPLSKMTEKMEVDTGGDWTRGGAQTTSHQEAPPD